MAETKEEMKHQDIDFNNIHPNDIAEYLSLEDDDATRVQLFYTLPTELKAQVFSYLEYSDQEHLLKSFAKEETAALLNAMAPDDRTEFFAELPDEILKEMVNMLDDKERKIAIQLLGYPEDSIARLMTPNYIQVKPHWTVAQVLTHIKKYGKKAETLNNIYVVSSHSLLIDDIQIGKILMAEPETIIKELCDNSFVALETTLAAEDATTIFEKYDRSTLPVITQTGILVGIVTIDDMIDVVNQMNTEDIQKFGGMEALDIAYRETTLIELFKKRVVWLIILFIGEMFTATAMGYYDEEISKAVVLALFVPLIISSGGNSGSQAATLIIRAMALAEISLRDWFYVCRKEIACSLLLGITLGSIGFIRITLWQQLGLYDYGKEWIMIAITIFISLLGVVMWGAFSGAMIPFILKLFKLDPATSSAPFVATLVDVTGLIIYFTIASYTLHSLLY